MKIKEKISWLMARLQRQLFPCLEACRISSLTEHYKYLVKIVELRTAENLLFLTDLQWYNLLLSVKRSPMIFFALLSLSGNQNGYTNHCKKAPLHITGKMRFSNS